MGCETSKPKGGPKKNLDTAKLDSMAEKYEHEILECYEAVDTNQNGILEAGEIGRVVKEYNGKDYQWDEKQFMEWYDVHGTPDGMIELKEFGWYLAHVALKECEEDAEKAHEKLGAVVAKFKSLADQYAKTVKPAAEDANPEMKADNNPAPEKQGEGHA